MCGIAGFVNFKEDLSGRYYQEIGENMGEVLTHRGPDAKGIWQGKNAVLSHARLAVIDPLGGTQPMTRIFGGAEYTIVYNGELYNTKEIRRELTNSGCSFSTASDTEVLLMAYIHYGAGCVHILNGIYAFAIWDGRKNELFMCRDRFGVKPLFYAKKDDFFLFGSEIKALFQFPCMKRILGREGVCEVLGIGPARTPGCGVFKGISEVPPGGLKIVSDSGIVSKNYYSLHSVMHTDSYEETVSTVRYLLQDAVRRQTVSDVPLCTFLSGGLDSSLITAITAEHTDKTLTTYSFDYEGNDKYFKPSEFQPNADKDYIDIMANAYQTDHHVLYQNSADLVKNLYAAVRHKDLPGMADVDSSLLGFCRQVKQKHTVALSGECADEIFGGYPWFFREEMLNCDTFPWCPDLKVRTRCFSKEMEKVDVEDYVRSRYTSFLSDMPAFPYRTPLDTRRQEIAYLNIYWFMATLLDRKDRMSMASGLEVRVPFCDHRLISYVWNIPWEMKAKNGERKHVLREAARGLLPETVRVRPKSPYPKTHNPDFERLVKAELSEVVRDRNAPVFQLIDREYAEKLTGESFNYGKPWFGQLMAGPQLIAYILQMNYWLKHYDIEIDLS